jgi:hypothetical protein
MNYIEQFWRDAKPEDAIKEPPRVARFRADDDTRFSSPLTLYGARRRFSEGWFWYASDGGLWTVCQVYDPPAGFEIGDGWIVIDVVGNTPREDDQFYDLAINAWCFCNEYLRQVSYDKNAIVRRRIEPPKPKYVPFEWEDREQLRGRWVVDGAGDEQCIVRIEKYKHSFCVNSVLIDDLLWGWTFLDTGEPVGKKVAQ